jgi:predicted nucleic acid-binding protein
MQGGSGRNPVVLDASVGVKWVFDEAGSSEADGLLRAQSIGEIQLVVASHFCYELVSVAKRDRGPLGAIKAWEIITGSEIRVVEVDDVMMRAAIDVSVDLGCSFYDAVAPALARLLDAPLYSADRRAHERVPGVVLLG